jgi:proton glutamate symport protein
MVAFSTPPMPPPPRRPWWKLSLGQQIVLALVVGVLFGHFAPHGWSQGVTFLRDIFLNLIKSLVAPLIFSSVVAGIAGGGSMKKVGRLGVKAIVYFEIATAVALAVGLAAVNLTRPGAGIQLPPDTGHDTVAKPLTIVQTIVHAFPSSIMDAMARNDVLQIVVFAVIIGLAAVAIGEEARPVVTLCNAVMRLMFKFTDIIMRFAPFGVFGAIAATVGSQGLGVLSNLGLLVGTLYAALVVFLLILIGAAYVLKLPVVAFLKAIKGPFVLAFATASSESALPKAMEAMEELGVPNQTVGFVIPAGYSFNLDGSTLYLALASVFAAEASHIELGLGEQIMIMLFLMVASKGVAAVPRASFVVLMAAIDKYHFNSNAATLILGVDALMDMARTSVNVFGNCLASMIVAKWEGEFPAKLD